MNAPQSLPKTLAPAVLLGLAATFVLVLAPADAGGQEPPEVAIETQRVADGLWMLTGRGGNLAVAAGPDAVFLVDDQYAPLTDAIRQALAELDPKPIRFVVNTHWHGDHTGGNENLGESGTLIVAHDAVRRRLESGGRIEAFARDVPPAPPAALPVVTFADGVTFHLNGETIEVRHVAPAHTDGDAWIRFREVDAVHLGDLYFNGMYPFIDVSSGGSFEGLIAAVEAVLAEIGEATRVIPGHGPLSDRSGLEAYRDMLVAVHAAVAPRVAAGESLEQIAASDPLAPWNERWGGGYFTPEQFLGFVYASLSD